jgi:UDP-N-acetylglucosamine 2-epimerase (non-hydrolysing)
VGSGTHAEETGKIMIGVERVLLKEKPDVVLVEGDTNTVLAGALASVKVGLPVGHVEAGLRSFDRGMPEEINRVVADHVSNLLFAPTERAKENLLREGVDEGKVFVTGNTIVDAVYQNLEFAESILGKSVFEGLGVTDGDYFLATIHRQENVDNPKRFRDIVEGLKLVQEYFGLPIIYPIHPRSRRRMEEYGLDPGRVIITEP